jgi:acyl-homoserine-lactone acylase
MPTSTVRHVLPIGLMALAVGLTACRKPAQPAYSAEVRRTSFGIPHIVAANELGIGYGAGYAYAQDNACLFAEMLVTVNGERSRYFGAQATGGPDFETGSIKLPNLQSDFFFRRLNAPEHVERAWQHHSPEAQDLVKGYVAGFNRHLREAGRDGLPKACRGAPWVRPITTQDIMRWTRRLAGEGASISIMQPLLAAAPPGAATETLAFELDLRPGSRGPLGSNGVALGKDATENGRGLLFANPHYPWYGSLRYYQVHLTIPGKLDAMGVTFGGFPVVRTGFNRNVAWTHTVNTAGHLAFYELTLDPQDPTTYVVDGERKRMTKETVTVDVRLPDGGVGRESHDFWHSEFGPLVHIPGRLEWTAARAYAVFDPSFDNHRMIDTWYAMDRAASLQELETAIVDHVGMPWTNTIAAGADGGTLYTNVSVVPRVTQAKQDACVAPHHRSLLQQHMWVLTASAACRLESVPGAPQPGIFAGREQPVLRRPDYVQNSNDSAWLTHPATPLTGFPPIVSAEDEPQSPRTRLGITQIAARLGGRDGLEGDRFDMRNLQQTVFSNRAYFGNLLRDDLRAACADVRPVEVDGKPIAIAEACAAFERWNGTGNQDSIGEFIAMKWVRGFAREKDIWVVPFSARDPVDTPRGLRLRDPAVRAKVRQALARAAQEAQQAGIDVSRPWGEIQYADFGQGRIPMHGADYDVYNLIRGDVGEGGIRVRYGSSHVQVVQFEDDGPRAEAFLTYSQSSDPDSPHHGDQTPRFAQLKWIPLPFTDAQIEADPAFSSSRIEE